VVRSGFLEILGRQSPAERAAMATAGLLTLLACTATVLPLFALARTILPARGAWMAAALWPVAPAVVLFHPTADTAYPLLATTALALASWSVRGGVAWAVLTGLVLGVGTQFSLVFLPIGLVVALLFGLLPGFAWRPRLIRLLAVSAGFLAVTLGLWALSRANPFVIWSWNARHHARFYHEYHRSRVGWALVNPVETAIAIGLPTAVWAGLGLSRRGPMVAWATLAVLAFLTLSGRNLGEVPRLWMAFFPALLVAAGAGLERFDAGPRTLAATVGLAGLQLLALQATIQVVYPV
jgi:hypothetical protein